MTLVKKYKEEGIAVAWSLSFGKCTAVLIREDLFSTALSQGSVHSAGSQRCAKNQDKRFKSRIALKIPTAAQRGFFNSCLTILFQETKVPHAI